MLSHGDVPRCQTKSGCPVKSEAQNRTLQEVVDAYLKARNLMSHPHLITYGQELLKQYNLDEPNLLLKLEKILQDYLKYKHEQEKQQKNLARETLKHGIIR
jgi:tRNA-dihydrouridine synthase